MVNIKLFYQGDKEVVLVTFSDKMNTDACSAVERDLLERLRSMKYPVLFDLKNVVYVSSAFFRICVQVAKDKGEGNFKVINSSPDIKKMFKIAGLDAFLK